MVKIISIGPGDSRAFEEEIKKRPAFVKFYMNGCGHCIAMKEAWEELGRELEKPEYDADISIIEVEANTVSKIHCNAAKNIDGYPTIRKVEKGGDKFKEYSGDRSMEDMLDFVLDNFKSQVSKRGGTSNTMSGGSGKPVDPNLYTQVKKQVYKHNPKHSAYRSGLLVKEYKRQFKTKYGTRKPYSGSKSNTSGLPRWFKEEWRNQRGEVGYRYKSDVYRPTRRITKNTPVTFRELSKRRVSRARREKSRKGRVYRFN